MGYIHDKLKEALGGNKVMDSKNTVIRDWTPNNIKVLVISRNYILVIHHVGGFGGSRVVQLDLEQVKSDLDRLLRNSGTSKLNSILNRRSLSCLEEIYVDSLFLETSVIDLVGYVRGLVGTTSRLRYFGYGEFPFGSDEWIRLAYQNNRRNFEYALALDGNSPLKLEYRDVGYGSWYKNYYLRPKYYKLDDDRGKLAMHFRKFEEDYKTYLSCKDKVINDKELDEQLSHIACVNDGAIVPYLKRFDTLLSLLSRGNGDSIKSDIFKICGSCVKREDVFDGLSYDKASTILVDSKDKDYLLKSYERFRVLDKSSKPVDKSKVDTYLKEGRGFINLKDILDTICVESINSLVNKGYKDLVGMALIMSEKDIPQGNLRNTYIKKSSNEGSIDGYFLLLGELVGVAV